MNESRYLLRFDDICPTMNWAVWEGIERALLLHGVRPILAVVPDNRDPGLQWDPPVADFWDRVRAWQARGYTIAVHGYQHVYINKDAGLMGLTPHSEFAGLPYEEQAGKLRKALAIFAEQGVRADAWVAPSHSFDLTTLQVLSDLGLTVICDGLWPWPHLDQGGRFWVPQQVWAFDPKPAGTWTVCYHHNDWSPARLEKFGRELAAFAPRMVDVATVAREFAGRRLTWSDRVTAWYDLVWRHRIKDVLQQVKLRLLKSGS